MVLQLRFLCDWRRLHVQLCKGSFILLGQQKVKDELTLLDKRRSEMERGR